MKKRTLGWTLFAPLIPCIFSVVALWYAWCAAQATHLRCGRPACIRADDAAEQLRAWRVRAAELEQRICELERRPEVEVRGGGVEVTR